MHKFSFLLATIILFPACINSIYAQSIAPSSRKPVFVIVHGAWGGSWAFKKVDSLLTEKNAIVYRPSLTGLGERVHLADSTIRLTTHIKDVVNMILFENLHNITLVGHSYGGMVITGVADSLPGRIASMIYLDAFVPEHGESLVSIAGQRAAALRQVAVNGFIIPSWVRSNQEPPKDVPHPLKTFTDPIKLKQPSTPGIKTVYILTVASGADAKTDDFYSQAIRAEKKGWKRLDLVADHNPQWSVPEQLATILFQNK